MSQKCRFHYRLPFYSSDDSNFIEFIKIIKDYFREQKIFVASTTTEGMLITKRNKRTFWEYAKLNTNNQISWSILERYYNIFDNLDQTNLLRILYSGKSDYLLNMKKIVDYNPDIDSNLKNAIEKNKVGKTSGWINKWIEYYMCKAVDIEPFKQHTFNEFNSKIKDELVIENIKVNFKKDFNEIYELLEMLSSQYQIFNKYR